MINLLAIGDPHGDLDKIKKIPAKDIDLILLTGDLGSASLARNFYFKNIEREKQGLERLSPTKKERKAMYSEVVYSSLNVLRYLSTLAPVYTIFGNVESYDAETRKVEKKYGLVLPKFVEETKKINGIKIINNKLKILKKARIGGLEYFIDTNWVEDFKPSNFNKRLKSAKKQTKKAKEILSRFKELDVLVCHQPPYKILDKVGGNAPKHWHGKNAGSKTILEYIKKYQPKYVFCGHIHEGEGCKKIGRTEVYNLGVCGYKLINL